MRRPGPNIREAQLYQTDGLISVADLDGQVQVGEGAVLRQAVGGMVFFPVGTHVNDGADAERAEIRQVLIGCPGQAAAAVEQPFADDGAVLHGETAEISKVMDGLHDSMPSRGNSFDYTSFLVRG